MFPSGNQFGGPVDPNGGPFSTGGSGLGGGAFEGPPPSDAMFGSMLPDEGEDLFDLEEFRSERRVRDSHDFLAIGLHFFESLKGPSK